MTDSRPHDSARHEPLDDSLFHLELERELGRVELTDQARLAEQEPGLADEHQRYYQWFEALCAPIRSALRMSTQPPDLPDYEGLEEIGRGGMGVVYRGRHVKTRRVDAIKVIRPDRVAVFPEQRQWILDRFERETQLAAQMAHDDVVTVYQVGEANDCPWFSMEYIPGATLEERAREAQLEPERAARYLERVARAVDAMHRQGVVHGDLKPRNILIREETDRPLVADFGVAEFLTGDNLTQDRGVGGSVAYLAPELAREILRSPTSSQLETRTAAADIYALGATFWVALTGETPWMIPGGAPDVSHLTTRQRLEDAAAGDVWSHARQPGSGRHLPSALKDICRQALALDPQARFSTAGQMADAIERWLDRPKWNRHFPQLRYLLWMIMAPTLLLSSLGVHWLLRSPTASWLAWPLLLSCYVPLFAVLKTTIRSGQGDSRANRELWSIWIGHCLAAIVSMILCQRLFPRSTEVAVLAYYPLFATLSALAFFAKSGNFWTGYRWIGLFWLSTALLMSLQLAWGPLLFGIAAAMTCVWIGRGDPELRDR